MRYIRNISGSMALAIAVVILFIVLLNSAGAGQDCDCYEFGTQQSTLGLPIYDGRSCECKCMSHVEGKNCDRCSAGFYNIKSRHGCKPCLCDINGSQDHNCDATTGQCACREGFAGYRCNVCKSFHFRKSQKQCEKCNCNIFGSIDLQCDGYGRCLCHDNVERKHCDRCTRFKHNLKQLCPDCPACYQKVNQSLRQLQEDLRETKMHIESFNSITHEDAKQFDEKLVQIRGKTFSVRDSMKTVKKPYEKVLSELKKKEKNFSNEINTMLLKMQGVDDLEKNITKKIKAADKIVRTIPALIKSAEASLGQVTQNISDYDDAMKSLARKSVKVHSNMATHLKSILQIQKQLNNTCASGCQTVSKYESIEEELHEKLKEVNMMLTTRNKTVINLRQQTGEIKNITEQSVKQNEENIRKLKELQLPKLTNYSHVQPNEQKRQKLAKNLNLYNEFLKATSNRPSKGNERLKSFEKNFKESSNEIQEIDSRTDRLLEEINSLVEKYASISEHNKTIEKGKSEMKLKLEQVPEMRDKIENLALKMKLQNKNLQELRLQIKASQRKLNDDLIVIKQLQFAIQLTQVNLSKIEANLSTLLTDMKTDSHQNLTNAFKEVTQWRTWAEDEAENLEKIKMKLAEVKEDMRKESEDAIEHMKKNIQALNDIIEYLNALPTTDQEFMVIEKELETTERILSLREEIEFLRREVAYVQNIATSMPMGAYCEKDIDLESKNLL